MQNKNAKIVVGVLVALLVVALAYGALTAPDKRSPAEKIGDAISKLDEGVEDAGRELESRTPAERIGDEIEDATDGSPQ